MRIICSLGIEEWRKSYAEHEKLGKKAVLFVMVDDTRNCDEVGALPGENLPRAARRGAGDSHQEQRRDFRGILRQEQGGTGGAAQAVQRDRHLEVAIQGHRLGADAQGRLGRAQRHRRSSACAPTPPRATSCRSKRSGAACAACTSAAISARPSPSWARRPSWISSNPSRAKASRSSTCRWAGRMAQSDRIRWSSRWTQETPTKTLTRSTLRCPGCPAASAASSRTSTQLDPAVVRQPQAAHSKPSRRKRPARSSSRPCSTPRWITRSSSTAAARRITAPSSRFFARQLLKDLRLVGGYDMLYRQGQDVHARSPVQPAPVDLEDPVILRNLSEPEVRQGAV